VGACSKKKKWSVKKRKGWEGGIITPKDPWGAGGAAKKVFLGGGSGNTILLQIRVPRGKGGVWFIAYPRKGGHR